MRVRPRSTGCSRTHARSTSQTSCSSPLSLNSPWLRGSKRPKKLRSARKLEARLRGFGELEELDELDELDELPPDLAEGPDGRGERDERDELDELPSDPAEGPDDMMKVLFRSQLMYIC